MSEERYTPVRLVIDNAEEPPEPADTDDDDHRHGGGGRDDLLPADCPAEALGKRQGIYYFLNDKREMIALKKLERLAIEELYGQHADRLDEHFPRKNADGDPNGWRPEKASRALSIACSMKPLFDPEKTLRGRGAWRDDDGRLVIHCGDRMYVNGKPRPPGMQGRYIMPAFAPIPHPWSQPVTREAGEELMALVGHWNWKREIDARLILGQIAATYLGGALEWRPVDWLIAPKESGKSTLLRAVRTIHDGWSIGGSGDSPASVWQRLGHDTIGVWLDETETGEDNRKLIRMVELARAAASGDKIPRGGADHNAVEFEARSAFTFSSIRYPPLLPQDRSRIAILRLLPLRANQKAPELVPAKLRALGRRLLRRLIDGWARFDQALEMYRAALEKGGHSLRGQMVYGTMLACADVLLADGEVNSETAHVYADQLTVDQMPDAGDDDDSDEMMWLRRLLSTLLPLDGQGPKNTVAYWLRQEARNGTLYEEAARVLGNHGIKVIRPKNAQVGFKPEAFAVSNDHTGLFKIHNGTHWAGRSGTMGGWVQPARDLPGACGWGTLRYGGVPAKGTAIPLSLVLDVETDELAERAEQTSFAPTLDD